MTFYLLLHPISCVSDNLENESSERSGYDAKACPIARGKFDSKKHAFGQVHGLI